MNSRNAMYLQYIFSLPTTFEILDGECSVINTGSPPPPQYVGLHSEQVSGTDVVQFFFYVDW